MWKVRHRPMLDLSQSSGGVKSKHVPTSTEYYRRAMYRTSTVINGESYNVIEDRREKNETEGGLDTTWRITSLPDK